MRIHRLGDDRGAVAVIVAMLMVVLVGSAAFVTDFGLAYVSKRQLQTAADAASLAAAGEFAKYGGNCTALVSNTSARAAAQSVADTIRESNRPASTGGSLGVSCSSDGTSLEISYAASGSTPGILGGIFGSGAISTSRNATAAVYSPDSLTGLRPYAICSTDLVDVPTTMIKKVSYPGSGCESPAGQWYQLDCPEVSSNSTSVFADKTRNGCSSPVAVVPGQPSPPADPSAVLIAACDHGASEDCLSAHAGNPFTSNEVLQAWKSLVGKTVTLPVFYRNTIRHPGTNGLYPVYRLAAATVCGYHWNAHGSHDAAETHDLDWADTQAADCAGANASSGGNSESYLLLHYTSIRASGSLTPGCVLGAAGCDFVRSVRLVK